MARLKVGSSILTLTLAKPSTPPLAALKSSSLLQAANASAAAENIIKLFSFILFKFKLNNWLFNSYRIHLINIPSPGPLNSPRRGSFCPCQPLLRRIWKSLYSTPSDLEIQRNNGTTAILKPSLQGRVWEGLYNCSITLITCSRLPFASALPARAASSRVDFAF